MGLRPAQCYKDIKKDRPYTRVAVRVPDKNYIGSYPQRKVRRFNMGHPLLKYDYIVNLRTLDSVQLRDNAIESVRQLVNRNLQKAFKDAYFMKVRVYPHQMLRENKMAQGAGADRVSKGMSLAFGRVIGRAARIKKGQILFSVLSLAENLEKTKKILLLGQPRLGIKTKIEFNTNVKSIGTIPNKVRGMEKEKEEDAAAQTTDAPAKEEAKTTGKTPAGKDVSAKDAKTPTKEEVKPAGKKK